MVIRKLHNNAFQNKGNSPRRNLPNVNDDHNRLGALGKTGPPSIFLVFFVQSLS